MKSTNQEEYQSSDYFALACITKHMTKKYIKYINLNFMTQYIEKLCLK